MPTLKKTAIPNFNNAQHPITQLKLWDLLGEAGGGRGKEEREDTGWGGEKPNDV